MIASSLHTWERQNKELESQLIDIGIHLNGKAQLLIKFLEWDKTSLRRIVQEEMKEIKSYCKEWEELFSKRYRYCFTEGA